MRLDAHSAPHIRSEVSSRTVMGDAVVTLGAIYIMTYFYYGQRAIALGLTSIITCLLCDTICNRLRHQPMKSMDFSAVITGMLIPLLMPATISYRIVIITGIFAICVVKQPFGGTGSNVFNPAAGGFAFAIVCWSKELFTYPMPFSAIPVTGEITVPLYSSAAYTLYVGGIPNIDPTNMMLGLSPGPMGTTNILVLLACMLYLVLRRTVRIQQPFFMLVTVAAIAWLNPRTSAVPVGSMFFELTAAPTVFFATFMF
ncbi:MAG: RnfABCDGE type electron transport complex subunit D, partial [Angelakisella sp.]